jgi:hypothetical protein
MSAPGADENGALPPELGGSGLSTNASFNDADLGYTLNMNHPLNNLVPSAQNAPPVPPNISSESTSASLPASPASHQSDQRSVWRHRIRRFPKETPLPRDIQFRTERESEAIKTLPTLSFAQYRKYVERSCLLAGAREILVRGGIWTSDLYQVFKRARADARECIILARSLAGLTHFQELAQTPNAITVQDTRWIQLLLEKYDLLVLTLLRGKGGINRVQERLFLPNPPMVPDDQLASFVDKLCMGIVTDGKHEVSLTKEEYSLLKGALPSAAADTLDFLAVRLVGKENVSTFGLSRGRAAGVIARYTATLNELASTRQTAATLAAASNAVDKQKAIRYQYRKHVEQRKVLQNVHHALAASRRDTLLNVPDMIGLLQAAARAHCGISKDSHDAPSDKIFMYKELFGHGDGGQTGFFHRVATEYCSTFNRTVSRGAVQRLMNEADVKFLKVRVTRQNPASDYYDHYCNAFVELVYSLFRVLFSKFSRTICQDAKQQIRLNSSSNNVQTKIAQCTLDDDRLQYHDHSANIVEKEGKLGLGTILMLNVPPLSVQQHISKSDLDEILRTPTFKDWKESTHFERKTGFCISFGHVERWDPETPCRNFNDVQEYINLYPEQFLMDDGQMVTALVIIGDNAKGPLDKVYQFCLGCLFEEHDFDIIIRISYAAYKSYRDPAEAGNGAIGRRTNGYPHQTDLDQYASASPEERFELLQTALRAVCAHADGARMSQYEVGEVRVRPASGPTNGTFEFRYDEIKQFLSCSAEEQREFKARPMEGWGHASKVHQRYMSVLRNQCLLRVGHECCYIMKRDGVGATQPWRGDGLMKSALSLWADSLPPIGTCTPVQLTLPSIVIAVNCLSFIFRTLCSDPHEV